MHIYLIDKQASGAITLTTTKKKLRSTRGQALLGSLDQLRGAPQGTKCIYTHPTFERRRKFTHIDGYLFFPTTQPDHTILDIMKRAGMEATIMWPPKITHRLVHHLRLFEKKGIPIGFAFSSFSDLLSANELATFLRVLRRHKL